VVRLLGPAVPVPFRPEIAGKIARGDDGPLFLSADELPDRFPAKGPDGPLQVADPRFPGVLPDDLADGVGVDPELILGQAVLLASLGNQILTGALFRRQFGVTQ